MIVVIVACSRVTVDSATTGAGICDSGSQVAFGRRRLWACLLSVTVRVRSA